MPLFDSEYRIASTSFSNHFARRDREEKRSAGATSRVYAKMLSQVIRSGLMPDIAKLELGGRGGAKNADALMESDRFHQRIGSATMPIAGIALSHGYQSTFAWIADLVGHVLLESKTLLKLKDIEGLVLLDEIDLYLHPTWQAEFVPALRRIFPKVQFVVSTHSPVVLAGVAPHEIVRLKVQSDSGDVVRGAWDSRTGELEATNLAEPYQPDPRAMTGSELYRSFFDIDRLTPNPRGDEMRRYLVLANDPERSVSDETELKKLAAGLKQSGVGELPAIISRSAGGARMRRP
ncbi:MAG: AAA family ATPase [Deltaproteobacteria bacterium]|nr:AAA family ATPase [Deltaproteobacteria bacterium]